MTGIDIKARKITPHSLRTSATTNLLAEGATDHMVVQTTGHLSIESLRAYHQLKVDDRIRIADRMAPRRVLQEAEKRCRAVYKDSSGEDHDAIQQLLNERRSFAPWYSPAIPADSIRIVSENRELVSLLSRIIHPNAGDSDLGDLLNTFAKDDTSTESNTSRLYLRVLTFSQGEGECLREAKSCQRNGRSTDAFFSFLKSCSIWTQNDRSGYSTGQGGDRKSHAHKETFTSRRIYTLGDIAKELSMLVSQGRMSHNIVKFIPVRRIPGVNQFLSNNSWLNLLSHPVDDECVVPMIEDTSADEIGDGNELTIGDGEELKILALYQIMLRRNPNPDAVAGITYIQYIPFAVHPISSTYIPLLLAALWSGSQRFELRDLDEMELTPIALALGRLQHEHKASSSSSSRRNCRLLQGRAAMGRLADLPYNYRLALFRDASLVKSKLVGCPDWQTVLAWNGHLTENQATTVTFTPPASSKTLASSNPAVCRPKKRNYSEYYRMLEAKETHLGTLSSNAARSKLLEQGLEPKQRNSADITVPTTPVEVNTLKTSWSVHYIK
ncbi:hypothetical protein HDU86_000440 [Geranomyces michiganensis]|nr:hypothetical protein HDU86_000440 [Geranomyces michiganensis]